MSITLSNVTKRFGKKTVIKDFTLALEKGMRVAIVAPSGSGKTTLFRIIAGLEKRFEGERAVDGKISLMFQEDRLFPYSTVLENITAVSCGDASRALSILEALGLGGTEKMYPSELSGGMKRRVALARALCHGGDIMLLDECFTGLDNDTKQAVAEVVNKETAGKTLLIITHDVNDAELLDCRIMACDDFKSTKNRFM